MGTVESIHVASAAGAPMRAVDRARALPGVGLEGDRYATGTGHWSAQPQTDRDLTLIEAEVVERLKAELGIALDPGQTRRNLTTRGVRLNELVGHRFLIGTVLCEGTRLCEPCEYLAGLVKQPVVGPLAHRGGLRAALVGEGDFEVGVEVKDLGPAIAG